MADPGKVRDNTFATDELSAGLKAARNELTSQVDSEEDRANIPYNKQVNVDMYSEENRQKRLLLKKDNEIIAAIDRWKILVGVEDAVKSVGMRAYMRLSGAVFVAVLGEDADANVLEDNWTADSKGLSTLLAQSPTLSSYYLSSCPRKVLH